MLKYNIYYYYASIELHQQSYHPSIFNNLSYFYFYFLIDFLTYYYTFSNFSHLFYFFIFPLLSALISLFFYPFIFFHFIAFLIPLILLQIYNSLSHFIHSSPTHKMLFLTLCLCVSLCLSVSLFFFSFSILVDLFYIFFLHLYFTLMNFVLFGTLLCVDVIKFCVFKLSFLFSFNFINVIILHYKDNI